MNKLIRTVALLSVLALQGCGWFTISDNYGNSYGGFTHYGDQYSWQLATCQNDPALAKAADPKRWMQCCMWRNGVPIDQDATGCSAPPYFNG